MTKYRVRNTWWEGLIEADEIRPSFGTTGDVWLYFYGPDPEESDMGEPLVGVVTPTLVAVAEEHLVEEVVLSWKELQYETSGP